MREVKGPVRFKHPLACLPRSGFVQDWIMFFAKPRLAARSNIISLIKRLAFYSFSFDFQVLQLLKRTCGVWGCTRLRLVSHALKLKFVLTRSPQL